MTIAIAAIRMIRLRIVVAVSRNSACVMVEMTFQPIEGTGA